MALHLVLSLNWMITGIITKYCSQNLSQSPKVNDSSALLSVNLITLIRLAALSLCKYSYLYIKNTLLGEKSPLKQLFLWSHQAE